MPLPAIIANNLQPVGALAPVGVPTAGGASPAAAPPVGGAAAKTLTFQMFTQEEDNWCWAAVAVSVAQFYDSSTTWTSQCNVASLELSKTCCPAGSNIACDVPHYLDKALDRVGHFDTWGNGPETLADIRAEIDSDRPLGVRIGWSNGGGHFLVISGYSTSATGDYVTVDDPIYQESTLLLSTFETAYQGTGSWTHSYWTQP